MLNLNKEFIEPVVYHCGYAVRKNVSPSIWERIESRNGFLLIRDKVGETIWVSICGQIRSYTYDKVK